MRVSHSKWLVRQHADFISIMDMNKMEWTYSFRYIGDPNPHTLSSNAGHTHEDVLNILMYGNVDYESIEFDRSQFKIKGGIL